MLLLRTFGGLTLLDGDTEHPIGAPRRKPLVILALVAASGARGVERDWVASMLWPELPETRARHALAQALYLLRREAGTNVFRDDPRLVLDPALIAVDATEFEMLARNGNSVPELERAVALQTGPYLEGVHFEQCADLESWIDGVRAGHARAYRSALRELAAYAARTGNTRQLIAWLERASREFPFDSSTASALADAYVAAGRPWQAEAHLRAHLAAVEAELGHAPTLELREVSRRVQLASSAPLEVAGPESSRSQSRVEPESVQSQSRVSPESVQSQSRVEPDPAAIGASSAPPLEDSASPRMSPDDREQRRWRWHWHPAICYVLTLLLVLAGSAAWAFSDKPPDTLSEVLSHEFEVQHRTLAPHRGAIVLRIRPAASGDRETDSLANDALARSAEWVRRLQGQAMLSADSVATLESSVRAQWRGRGQLSEEQETYEMLRLGDDHAAIVMSALWYQDTLHVQLALSRRAKSREMHLERRQGGDATPIPRPSGPTRDGLETIALPSIELALVDEQQIIRSVAIPASQALTSLRTCKAEAREDPIALPWCWSEGGELQAVKDFERYRPRGMSTSTTRPPGLLSPSY